MTKVLGVRLSYNGCESAFLEEVHEIVRKVRAVQEKEVLVLVDVREVPVLIDPRILYDACMIISNSLEVLDAVTGLTLLCKEGLQESLTRSTLKLIPSPWAVEVITEAPAGDFLEGSINA
jgi:hypothetical protein